MKQLAFKHTLPQVSTHIEISTKDQQSLFFMRFHPVGNATSRKLTVTGEPNEWKIAVCGLNCAKCPIYQAYHRHDIKFQQHVSSKISSDAFTYPPEAIKCDGCRGDPALQWNPECTFKPCAAEKGHSYCFECDSFPCNKLEAFTENIPHHKRTVENMKRMRKVGLHRWIREQKEKGQCSFCP